MRNNSRFSRALPGVRLRINNFTHNSAEYFKRVMNILYSMSSYTHSHTAPHTHTHTHAHSYIPPFAIERQFYSNVYLPATSIIVFTSLK